MWRVVVAAVVVPLFAGCLDVHDTAGDLRDTINALPSWPLKVPLSPDAYVDEYRWNVTAVSARTTSHDGLVDVADPRHDPLLAEGLRILLEIERREPGRQPLGEGGAALNGTEWVGLAFLTPYGVPLPHLAADDPRFAHAYFLLDRSDPSHGHPVLCEEKTLLCAQYTSGRNFMRLEALVRDAAADPGA